MEGGCLILLAAEVSGAVLGHRCVSLLHVASGVLSRCSYSRRCPEHAFDFLILPCPKVPPRHCCLH